MVVSKKTIVYSFLLFLLVIGIYVGVKQASADKSDNNPINVEKEKIIIEGIVANDFFDKHPSTIEEALNLTNNKPKKRTGWSVKYYACKHSDIGKPNGESDKNSPWREQDIHVTDDSGRDKRYNVEDYYDQIIKLYGKKEGQRIYELAVDNNVKLVYDQKRGKNMVYSYLQTPLPCKDGDVGFYYNDMEFYLTVTFEVTKENEKSCKNMSFMELVELYEKGELPQECIDDLPEPVKECLKDKSKCGGFTIPTEEVPIPMIGTKSKCPAPYIPSQIKKVFEYEIDLVTERIEGKTVDKGRTTTTPVTVYRETFKDKREAIKEGLRADLEAHERMADECTQIINEMQEELAKLEETLTLTEAAYAACLNTSYWVDDEDYSGGGYWEQADCSAYPPAIDALKKQINALKKEIELAEQTLEEIGQVIAAISQYLAIIEKVEGMFEIISSTVLLTVNDDEIDEQPVRLGEKERVTLEYDWTLNEDSLIAGWIDPENPTEVYPVCNGKVHPCETTNDNNIKTTPIYISTRQAINACVLDGETAKLEGIVRTIQEGNTLEDVQNVYERATSRMVIEPTEKVRRAGYGFHYVVYTTYENDDIAKDRETKGVRKMEGFKPTIIERHMPYTQSTWSALKTTSKQKHVGRNDLTLSGYSVESYEKTSDQKAAIDGQPYAETSEWELPYYAVGKFSGDVYEGRFDDVKVSSKANEQLLDGGRKWYTAFELSDMEYRYQTLFEDIGVNRLALCNEGVVSIDGKPIGDKDGNNDFVFRFVDASNPFPMGTGWNWQYDEGLLTNMSDWFKHLLGGRDSINYEEQYEIQHE